jgi:hypothetical protein
LAELLIDASDIHESFPLFKIEPKRYLNILLSALSCEKQLYFGKAMIHSESEGPFLVTPMISLHRKMAIIRTSESYSSPDTSPDWFTVLVYRPKILRFWSLF